MKKPPHKDERGDRGYVGGGILGSAEKNNGVAAPIWAAIKTFSMSYAGTKPPAANTRPRRVAQYHFREYREGSGPGRSHDLTIAASSSAILPKQPQRNIL